jgi:hypothetical protein
MGFAPPPYDGFAFLASAHTDALGCQHIPDACYECTIRLYRSRVCVPQHKNRPNFVERRLAELPRIPKRRSSQNFYSTHSGE